MVMAKRYKVHKVRMSKRFTSCMEIKEQLLARALKEHIACDKFDIGYTEAGQQGVYGKMRWIFSSEPEDIDKSYKSASKTEITLWCDGRKQIAVKKRPATEKHEGGSKKS